MFILQTSVQDIDTKETLPFASIAISDSKGNLGPVPIGTKTDNDGNFSLQVNDSDYIKVSYVGYQTINHPADDYRNDIIYLKKNTYTTKEVKVTAKRIKKQAPPPPPKKKDYTFVFIAIGAICVMVAGMVIYKFRAPKKAAVK